MIQKVIVNYLGWHIIARFEILSFFQFTHSWRLSVMYEIWRMLYRPVIQGFLNRHLRAEVLLRTLHEVLILLYLLRPSQPIRILFNLPTSVHFLEILQAICRCCVLIRHKHFLCFCLGRCQGLGCLLLAFSMYLKLVSWGIRNGVHIMPAR